MKTKTMTNLLRLVLIAAAALCGVFFFLCLPSYGQEIVQADPEFAWAYWPCLVWAWLFALPIFGAMIPGWRIFGSISAPLLIRLFRVKDPMTAGLAIGACSHAVGTSKALELGETEGAMSGLAIGICGVITVVLSLIFF